MSRFGGKHRQKDRLHIQCYTQFQAQNRLEGECTTVDEHVGATKG